MLSTPSPLALSLLLRSLQRAASRPACRSTHRNRPPGGLLRRTPGRTNPLAWRVQRPCMLSCPPAHNQTCPRLLQHQAPVCPPASATHPLTLLVLLVPPAERPTFHNLSSSPPTTTTMSAPGSYSCACPPRHPHSATSGHAASSGQVLPLLSAVCPGLSTHARHRLCPSRAAAQRRRLRCRVHDHARRRRQLAGAQRCHLLRAALGHCEQHCGRLHDLVEGCFRLSTREGGERSRAVRRARESGPRAAKAACPPACLHVAAQTQVRLALNKCVPAL